MSAGPRVLVAGVGNLFLGDDGFGPEVVRRLDLEATEEPTWSSSVRVIDYGIRGLHLAYDLLDGYDALVLVDTVPSRGTPGRLSVLEVTAEDLSGGEVDAHGMDPAAMLGNLGRLGGTLPRTVVVGCEPVTVEEGIGLSGPVEAAVGPAVDAVRTVVSALVAGATLLPLPAGAR
ncbi:MAG: hydrogenase maturation protease [bacterium]